jgi:hypothetical protein
MKSTRKAIVGNRAGNQRNSPKGKRIPSGTEWLKGLEDRIKKLSDLLPFCTKPETFRKGLKFAYKMQRRLSLELLRREKERYDAGLAQISKWERNLRRISN